MWETCRKSSVEIEKSRCYELMMQQHMAEVKEDWTK
jgi:hypothetical protein